MRIIVVAMNFACVSLVLFFTTCRKADVFPDYEPMIGKYRCIFIQKSYFDTAAGNIVYDTIFPQEEYTVEFKKNRKVIMSRSGECVMDRKVIRCEYHNAIWNWIEFDLREEDPTFTFTFKNSETVFIQPSFFPGNYYDQQEVDVYYTTFYVKE